MPHVERTAGGLCVNFLTGGDGKAIEEIENKVKAIQGSFIFLGPHKEVLFSQGLTRNFLYELSARSDQNKGVEHDRGMTGINKPQPPVMQQSVTTSLLQRFNGLRLLAIKEPPYSAGQPND